MVSEFFNHPEDDLLVKTKTSGVFIVNNFFLIFSSFMRAHAQAMNEYRGVEMSTEVVVDGNLWTEIVDRRRK